MKKTCKCDQNIECIVFIKMSENELICFNTWFNYAWEGFKRSKRPMIVPYFEMKLHLLLLKCASQRVLQYEIILFTMLGDKYYDYGLQIHLNKLLKDEWIQSYLIISEDTDGSKLYRYDSTLCEETPDELYQRGPYTRILKKLERVNTIV